MPTKLEIWRELGKRLGTPAQGTPEYEHKKEVYIRALQDIPITDEAGAAVAPAAATVIPRRSACICPCECSAQRVPMMCPPEMGTSRVLHSKKEERKKSNRRIYSDSETSDSESEPERPIKRAPMRRLITSSDSESESDDEPVRRKAPPKRKEKEKRDTSVRKKSATKTQKAKVKSKSSGK